MPGWRGQCTWAGRSRSRGGGGRGCESHAPSRRLGDRTRRACWCCSAHLAVGTRNTDRTVAEPFPQRFLPSHAAAIAVAGEGLEMCEIDEVVAFAVTRFLLCTGETKSSCTVFASFLLAWLLLLLNEVVRTTQHSFALARS